jgi:nitrate reductase gamma subunit
VRTWFRTPAKAAPSETAAVHVRTEEAEGLRLPSRERGNVSTAFAILFYAATAILLLGLGFKIAQFARTPAPLKIPTTPAPITQAGAAFRVGREVALFESLFKANKPLWISAVLFHLGLLLVLIRHLRYFMNPVWLPVQLVQPFALYVGLMMVAGLVLLALRRAFIQRIAYITGPSDWLMLLLLLGIGITGLTMNAAVHTNIIGVKAFFLGLLEFRIRQLPADPLLAIHLGLVATLMIVFPFSKLLHVPGVFFSPSRNQADNPREHRHVVPWVAELDAGSK